MRVFVVEAGSRVRVHRGAVVVETREGERFPVTGEVDQLILGSGAVSVTVAALRRLAGMGIDVVVLDSRGSPVARLHPPVVNRTVEARLGQYRSRGGMLRVLVARELVSAKIWNQARLLRYLAKSLREDWLRDAALEVEARVADVDRALGRSDWADALRAAEAAAARRYWGAIASVLPGRLGFHGRDQDAPDPFNAALNYGYAILYGACDKALTLAGLDPYLGVLHATRSGRPSLTLDFMEPFRPIAVDKALVTDSRSLSLELTPGGLLTYESRREVARRVLGMLEESRLASRKRRRRAPLWSHIRWEAWDLAHTFRTGEPYTAWRVVM